ncbi:hypothetical protein [Pseudomonas mandelii]|uniref:Phage protein n=1 Tax=Pseudomonas mandelii TaxID=75612 RepID=A0ABY0VUL3_9PSED|nr:hypothetical protein [Pseudomonas mandelii]TWS08765.1 hypothetical protein FJD35_20045 [Pseudomonas mandelii]SDU56661.1 hypothetical protein SAMN04489801_4497 [Pseudomonas mandelii]
MPEEPFNLDQLYRAIEQHLKAHLPGVHAVTAWPNIKDRIALPAVFIELAEMEPGLDIGTGQTSLICKFEARIIVDPIRPQYCQQAAHLAAQLAVLLRLQTWGLEVEPAEFVQAMQDWTKPELDGYVVWSVEWTQQVYLGDEEWPWPDEPPGSLLFGFNDAGKDEFFRPEELP